MAVSRKSWMQHLPPSTVTYHSIMLPSFTTANGKERPDLQKKRNLLSTQPLDLVPFPFAFAWLNALQAVKHLHSSSDPVLCWVTQANWRLTALKKNIEQQLKWKGLNCNNSSFKVLGAFDNHSFGKLKRCFYESKLSHWKSFLSYHLIWLQQSTSNPMNEPSCKLICKPTKQMDLDAEELPNNLSPEKTRVAYSEPKQDAELPSKITDSTNTQTCGWCHDKSETESFAD